MPNVLYYYFWRSLIRSRLPLVVSAGVTAWSDHALAGGGRQARHLVNVADTRDLEPGLSRLIADIYNESLLLYGVLTVVSMVVVGVALGLLTDKALALLGIHLGRLERHE